MSYPPHAADQPAAASDQASSGGANGASHANGASVVHLATRARFRFDSGREVELAIVDAYYEFADLAKEMQGREGTTHKDYLRELGRRIVGWFGVELTLGELDELNEAVATQYLAKKKRQAVAIDALLTLQPSTSSGRAG